MHGGNLAGSQCHQVTALVGGTLLARAFLASHVPLEFVDRRPLRPPDDVERYRLVRFAAETLHLQVPIAGVESVAERRGRLGRALEGEHAGVPRLAGRGVGRQPSFLGPLGQVPDRHAEHVLARLGSHSP